jgi:hypothetical protein
MSKDAVRDLQRWGQTFLRILLRCFFGPKFGLFLHSRKTNSIVAFFFGSDVIFVNEMIGCIAYLFCLEGVFVVGER